MRTPSRKSSYTLANKEQEMDARNEAIIFDSNESEKTLKLTLESDHCQANNNDKESSQNVQNVEKSSHQIIQNFVPNWFAMTLSWGATALIIRTLPNLSSYPNLFKIFDLSAKIIFFWNTLYFLLFLGILFYPKPENLRQNLVRKIIEHPIKSNFLALIPMTFGVWAGLYMWAHIHVGGSVGPTPTTHKISNVGPTMKFAIPTYPPTPTHKPKCVRFLTFFKPKNGLRRFF